MRRKAAPRRKADTARPKVVPASVGPAAKVAQQVHRVLAKANSEEDLRIGIEMLIRNELPDLSARYEQTVKTSTFTGRTDAMHRRLVIEYEKPHSMSAAAKKEHAVKQVTDYLTAIAGNDTETTASPEERLSRYVGVATDGSTYVFVQRRYGVWHREELPLGEDAIERLLLWVRTMDRKDLSPENLLADFGPQTEIAQELVRILAQLVDSRLHAKANVIYAEWRRLFEIVYGDKQLKRARREPEPKALMSAYQLKLGLDYPALLFSVHTYFALLMKLLATELIVAQGSWAETFVGALGGRQLRSQLRKLESGEILRVRGIRNVVEQDFFGWYTEAWTPELNAALGRFAKLLSAYDLTAFQLQPERARDLLKDLYHGLVPDAVRHALGEYYTPDWLAEHTVELAGYDGDPAKTFLDPSCGSGTFLVTAIQRVRQWLSARTVEWGSNEKKVEAVCLIRQNIVGFDLNPLAVIAARTNYLFALGPLLRYRGTDAEFEVPVYLTDSVLLPGRVQEQVDLLARDTVQFPTAVGVFKLPREAIERHTVPDLMNLLHEAISDAHHPNTFVTKSVARLGLRKDEATRTALKTLFDTMSQLDSEGKNRVWARLIRNRYAALFYREHFDFVVGNPPHIAWETLTPEWRKAAEEEYRAYGLFSLSGFASRHGGGKKDIAALFTYAALDHFLKPGGVLALIVHVSLFKTSGAGEGFRRFQLGDGQKFAVQEAHDFQSFQPFKTRSAMKIKTRTLSFRAVKGQATQYPVPYHVWSLTKRGIIPSGSTWEDAAERVSSEELSAEPLLGTSTPKFSISPWLTVRRDALKLCRRAIAPQGYKPHYRARAGMCTWLNGVYFLEVLERMPDGSVLIENMHDCGKKTVSKVRATIEGDLVHPLLRGRDVARWKCATQSHILVVQDPKTQKGYPEKWMQHTHPQIWKYLKSFESQLRERPGIKKYYRPTDPFYSIYDVTTDSFSSHRVVWMDVSATVKAVVLSDARVAVEHKCMLLATETEDEAHYVAAVMNSALFNEIVQGYTVDNSISTHPIKNIVVPRFEPEKPAHQELVGLSKTAHSAAGKGKQALVDAAQLEIDQLANTLW